MNDYANGWIWCEINYGVIEYIWMCDEMSGVRVCICLWNELGWSVKLSNETIRWSIQWKERRRLLLVKIISVRLSLRSLNAHSYDTTASVCDNCDGVGNVGGGCGNGGVFIMDKRLIDWMMAVGQIMAKWLGRWISMRDGVVRWRTTWTGVCGQTKHFFVYKSFRFQKIMK